MSFWPSTLSGSDSKSRRCWASRRTAYGRIAPDQPVDLEHANILDVHQFWEKPSADLAKQLLDRGCLWKSFVMVARVSKLLGLIMAAAPELCCSFARISVTLLTNSEERSVERVYASLGDADFSRDVLARHPTNLAVLPGRACGMKRSRRTMARVRHLEPSENPTPMEGGLIHGDDIS